MNIRHVTEMGENYFRTGPVVIGISKKYLKSVKDQYYTYLFSQMGERPESFNRNFSEADTLQNRIAGCLLLTALFNSNFGKKVLILLLPSEGLYFSKMK